MDAKKRVTSEGTMRRPARSDGILAAEIPAEASILRRGPVTDSHAERRAALIIGALAAPWVLLTVLVSVAWGPLMSFDRDVVSSWHGAVVDTPWAHFFRVVARVSQPWTGRLALLAVASVLAARKETLKAVWIVAVLAITAPAWIVTKHLVERQRPDVPAQIGGWSYPSGHATEIAATMGLLIVLTVQRVRHRRLRRTLVVLWLAVAALVGADRVFVGAHFPSDVIGGWLLGALVVLVVSTIFGVIDTDRERPVERPLSSMPEDYRSLAVILNPVKILDADAFKTRVGLAARAGGWDEPLWFETTIDDAGASMARAAVAAGADVVVAAGGDGTVRVVCAEMAGTGIPVGVIPAGTGNLLARNLGIPLSHDEALDTVLRGQDRAIDVVSIEGDHLQKTRFVVMAGLGLDAAIMDGAADALKARIGWPAYVVAGARHLRFPAVRVDISIDGAEPVRRRARTVVIGNVGSLQAGIPLLPDAQIDDGVLDVVVIAPRRLFGWVPLALRVFTKRKWTDDRLDRFTGHSVSLTVPHPTPRQLDGDTVGPGTEIRARIEPGLLLVRVPR
jgi:diacylglycerol kinase family enzyme/membrane-associated phospholipid phosphatase